MYSGVVPSVCSDSSTVNRMHNEARTPPAPATITHHCPPHPPYHHRALLKYTHALAHQETAYITPYPRIVAPHNKPSTAKQKTRPRNYYQANPPQLPTMAWFTAAPSSARALTASTCPFLLATNSGVAPFVCPHNHTSHPYAQIEALERAAIALLILPIITAHSSDTPML